MHGQQNIKYGTVVDKLLNEFRAHTDVGGHQFEPVYRQSVNVYRSNPGTLDELKNKFEITLSLFLLAS
jgi:hypothetical protein